MLRWHVAQECGDRDYQEDRYHVVVVTADGNEAVVVAGVYDGHGNASVSTALANEQYGLAPALVAWRAKHGRFPDSDDATAVFHQVDRFIWHLWMDKQRARTRKQSSSGGSTAVVAALDGAHLTLYNVGDSRAVVVDALDGRVVYETKDHKPSRADERARIVAKGGVVSRRKGDARTTSDFTPYGYGMTRAMGDFELKDDFNERLLRSAAHSRDDAGAGTGKGEPVADDDDDDDDDDGPDHDGVLSATPELYAGELDLARTHYVVLASDGLWDGVDAADVGAWVREHGASGGADACKRGDALAKYLAAEALRRETGDNVTVLVLEVGEPTGACLARMTHDVVRLLGELRALDANVRSTLSPFRARSPVVVTKGVDTDAAD